jgi:hypothetical protein
MDHRKLKLDYIYIGSQGKKKESYLGSENVIIGSRIMDNPLMISSESSMANGTEEYKHSIHTSVKLELLQQRRRIY